MKSATTVVLALVTLTPLVVRGQEHSAAQEADDSYRWLEEVEGEDALAWVAAHNERTLAALEAYPAFDSIFSKNLEVYNSDARIITPEFRGEYVYELWQNEQHERGLWRRTLFDSYLAGRPDWETLLDVDSLAKGEDEEWVYGAAGCLPPENIHCLVRLTRGGGDAAVLREFDLAAKTFVEGGFFLPEAITYYVWKDANTIWVATDFGEGTTTRYGRPRIVKAWRRGLPLEQAEVLFEGNSTDLLVFPVVEHSDSRIYYLIAQLVTRSKTNVFALENSRLVKLDVPVDAYSRIHPAAAQLVLLLKSDWHVGDTTCPQGALLSIDYDDFLAGDRSFEVVFEPDERSYVFSMDATKNSLLVNMLRNARSELYQYRREGGRWIPEHVSAPDHATTYYTGLDRDSDRFFYTFEGFLTPRTLSLSRDDGTIVHIDSEPLFFDAESLVVNQHETTSRDGTRVPYFIVHHRNMDLDGHNPTLLYSYGGFGTPMVPYYEPVVGTAWLARGGVYVLANIRGGGEFGPRWHRAALRENRQRA